MKQKEMTAKGPPIFQARGTGTLEEKNTGTFGSVFLIPPDVEDRLDSELAASRVKVRQDVKIVMRSPDKAPVIRMHPCFTHFDPRNTADGYRNLWTENNPEKCLWQNGLMSLRKSGVPEWYLNQIYKQLLGLEGATVPIRMDMVEICSLISAPTLSPLQRFCRIQKQRSLTWRQTSLRYPSAMATCSAPGDCQFVRPSPDATTPHSQGRSFSAVFPVRRQQAIIPPGPVSTWHPQVHSLSAKIPQRHHQLVQFPPSPVSAGNLQGRSFSTAELARDNQVRLSLGTESSRTRLAWSSPEGAPIKQTQGLSLSATTITGHPHNCASIGARSQRYHQVQQLLGRTSVRSLPIQSSSSTTSMRHSPADRHPQVRLVRTSTSRRLSESRSSFGAQSARFLPVQSSSAVASGRHPPTRILSGAASENGPARSSPMLEARSQTARSSSPGPKSIASEERARI
jgi:hypothetical protein